MATGLANSSGLSIAPEHQGDRVIQAQLRRAGRYVKWVEAGSQLLTLLIGTLVFFLAAALIDHWIISLGWFGRWLLCLTFVGGCGWFIVRKLLPLLVRGVNPTYSARAIEEATPTLKNSLVNFLLLKDDHAGVKASVMHALETRAASDISGVEVETAIDRAPLIRVGYVLCGVMAVVALYKIASPKDPFQTAARVVAPWADLARPSRVLIRDVQPGHTSVYLGSHVEVTADVQGASGKDGVRLVYSSADGQVQDRAIVMKNSGGGNRYVASLPAPDVDQPMGRTGLQQGVQYHIEAGDALSSIYEIRVRMAPTIAVEKAELVFPTYMQKPPQTQPTGEIKALEGTRVTIHARANQPIKTAFLELDPRPGRAAETIPLQVEGQNARGGFTLQLKADRVTPWRESYQVRFTNEQGEISEQPVIHKLEVTPDLPPEVEILQPRLQKLDLPEDGRLTIEVRGVDPDFALFDLHVAGKSPAGELFRKSLLPPGEPRSQSSGKFDFLPATYNLKAGTVVTYQGVAIDNRRDPVSGQPQPGRAETAEYVINIVAPLKPKPNDAQNPNQNPNAQNPPPNNPEQKPKPGENNQKPMPKPGENPPMENRPMNPMDPMNQPMPGEQQPPMPGENPQQQPQPNQPNNNPQQNQQPNQQPKPNQPKPNQQQEKPKEGEQQSGGQSGDGQGQSTSGSGNNAKPGSGSGQPNNNSQPNNNQQPMPGENGQSGAQNQPGQNQPGSQNQPGGDAADPSQQPGNEGDPNGAARDQNIRPGSGGQQNGGKPEHDGEKFEKMLEDLKKMKEQLDKQKQQGNNGGGGQETGQQSPNNSQPKPNPQQPNSKGNNQPGGPGEKAPGEKGAGDKPENTEQLLKDLEKMIKEQQAKDAREGKTPQPNDQTAQESGQPGQQPNGQPAGAKPMPQPGTPGKEPGGNPMPGGQGGEKDPMGSKPMGEGNQPKPGEGAQPKPGEGAQPKPGEQGKPGTQPKPNEGGSPQGAPRNEGNQPMPKPGEQKTPGAGENGNPGAGEQSKDPTGSAQGDQPAQDKPKDMQNGPGNSQNPGEASPPAQGKKNSDSKGGESGDQRGGGKQGAGQSAGAAGNDSAGGNSPGDEGAGKANEQGQGETGTKAGKGPEAAGKTGQSSGNKPGEGTATKPGEKGAETDKGGEPGKEPGKKGSTQPGGSNSGGDQIGKGDPTGAGTDADRSGQGITRKSADAADEANLEYTRRVTDLVLQSLRDQEHNPDPELAKRNGLTPQELQEFARKWSQLKKDAEADPAKARELDEALRSLGMQAPKNRVRRETTTDKQRDLRDAGGRTQAPSKYREQFDRFRKSTGGK